MFHLVMPQGQDSAFMEAMAPCTNQHEEGDMDPFPLVMFVSFDAGELIISMKTDLHSKYSKAQIAASRRINT